MDDMPGQLRTRLTMSSAVTQLNLGYLVQQAPGLAQRGSYRGRCLELRTDAWAVLSWATARAYQSACVASTKIDAAEATGLLRGAGELSKVLSDASPQ